MSPKNPGTARPLSTFQPMPHESVSRSGILQNGEGVFKLETLHARAAAAQAKRAVGLYVHVPFCVRKCSYCSFYSVELSEGPGGPLSQWYLDAVLKEFELASRWVVPDTIYVGGGTPSILTVQQWERLCLGLTAGGRTAPVEWTVECNPGTVSLEVARQLRALGVTRISLGIQSTHDYLLRVLGRIHTAHQALYSFELLRKAGFGNINVDLIYGIPGQTLELWKQTLKSVLDLAPEHLSLYELAPEKDTEFFRRFGPLNAESHEELVCSMYELAIELLEATGFQQYEVSNFARGPADAKSGLPRFACLHNVKYWRGQPYIGLGPAAASYFHGIRMHNVSDLGRYCQLAMAGLKPVERGEQLPPLARAGETAAFGLRMTMGWGLREFTEITGFDLLEHWGAEIGELVELGWAELGPDRFRLTRRGLRFADTVAGYFLR